MIRDGPSGDPNSPAAPVDAGTAFFEVRFALLAALGAAGGRRPADWSRDTPAVLLGDVGPPGWQVRLQAAARMLEDAGYRCAAVPIEAAADLFTRPLADSAAAIFAKLCRRRARIASE